jgi:hypothetical protein
MVCNLTENQCSILRMEVQHHTEAILVLLNAGNSKLLS